MTNTTDEQLEVKLHEVSATFTFAPREQSFGDLYVYLDPGESLTEDHVEKAVAEATSDHPDLDWWDTITELDYTTET